MLSLLLSLDPKPELELVAYHCSVAQRSKAQRSTASEFIRHNASKPCYLAPPRLSKAGKWQKIDTRIRGEAKVKTCGRAQSSRAWTTGTHNLAAVWLAGWLVAWLAGRLAC